MLIKEIKENKIQLYPDNDLITNTIKDLVPETKELLTSAKDFEEVVLDLKNVKIVDTIGISFIIGLYKTTQNREKKFRITGLNNEIKNVFELMKFNNLFEF